MSRARFVLHSSISPVAIADALRRSIYEERWTLFSLSRYQGALPALGKVGETAFRLQNGRYSRNDFAGHFYGKFEPEPGGTKIQGYFDVPPLARIFMRIWLAGAVLIGTPIFLATLADLTTGRHFVTGDRWVGLVVPPALVCFGTVLPRLSRLLGKSDRQFILEHLQKTLAARIDGSEAEFEAALRKG